MSVTTLIERDTVVQLNHLHAQAQRAYGEALDCAIAAGELLVSIRDTLQHGEWLPWLAKNFHGSRTTAYNYISCAEHRPAIEDLQRAGTFEGESLSVRGALAAVAPPKPREIEAPQRKMSGKEISDVFQQQPAPVVAPKDRPAVLWTSQHERKHDDGLEGLSVAIEQALEARNLTDPTAAANAYRSAAARATRAANTLDDLAQLLSR